jgi:hypothetical protein
MSNSSNVLTLRLPGRAVASSRDFANSSSRLGREVWVGVSDRYAHAAIPENVLKLATVVKDK